MSKIETIQIVDCFEFLERDLSPRGKFHYLLGRFVFRGEARSDYSLLPTILRKETRSKWLSSPFNEWSDDDTQSSQLHLELKILRRFFQLSNKRGLMLPNCRILECDDFVAHEILKNLKTWYPLVYNNENSFALMTVAALAQHYGAPTRFLDWTYDINTALFFAACKPKEIPTNNSMIIWAIDKKIIDNYEAVQDMPFKFITPLYYLNPNLRAQNGTLVCHNEPIILDDSVSIKPFDKVIQDIQFNHQENKDITLMYRFEIPESQRDDLFKYLHEKGLDESYIFQGKNYGSVVDTINYEASID